MQHPRCSSLLHVFAPAPASGPVAPCCRVAQRGGGFSLPRRSQVATGPIATDRPDSRRDRGARKQNRGWDGQSASVPGPLVTRPHPKSGVRRARCLTVRPTHRRTLRLTHRRSRRRGPGRRAVMTLSAAPTCRPRGRSCRDNEHPRSTSRAGWRGVSRCRPEPLRPRSRARTPAHAAPLPCRTPSGSLSCRLPRTRSGRPRGPVTVKGDPVPQENGATAQWRVGSTGAGRRRPWEPFLSEPQAGPTVN